MPDSPEAERYRPFLELGHGRVSRAYLAESLASGVHKLVVLKLLNRELCDDPRARETFRHEASISAHLNHSNTVYVFEVGEHDGSPMIVMEYLEGIPLTRVLSHAGYRLPLGLRVYILAQMLGGLHHLHELKDLEGNQLRAVHRDVSPHNVILLHQGGVKLVGFGAAQATVLGHASTLPNEAAGKLQYMAPEQLLGSEPLDGRADVYSAGVMLWEALARRPMWRGTDTTGIVRALADGKPPDIDVAAPEAPPELREIAMRALSPERGKRFASAQLMQIALERAARETIGAGAQRDLVRFMEGCFGAERERRCHAIASAMRAEEPCRVASGTRELEPRASEEGTMARPSRSRVRTRGLGAVGALALAAGALLAARAPKAPAEQTHATARGANVQAAPRRAAGEGSHARRPTSGATSSVRTGPGAHSAFDGDAPFPADQRYGRVGLASSPSAARDSPPRAALDALTPAVHTPHAAAVKRAPRESASARLATAPEAAPEANACTPPFDLTEDGIKAFKPDCF